MQKKNESTYLHIYKLFLLNYHYVFRIFKPTIRLNASRVMLVRVIVQCTGHNHF